MTVPESEATNERPGDLSDRERRALSLIRDRGGVYQSDLWKELDVSSRSGTRIARGLASRGLITRTETTHRGRRTYLLSPVEGETPSSGERGGRGGETTPAASPGGDLTATERRALDFVCERAPVSQSELRRLLDVPPEAVEEAVRSLVEADRLRREETTLYGRRTYLLSPVETDGSG